MEPVKNYGDLYGETIIYDGKLPLFDWKVVIFCDARFKHLIKFQK